MRQENEKGFALQEACKLQGFEKTNHYVRDSFIMGCLFYKTKYDDIYVTDYDFRSAKDPEKEGLFMLLYKAKGSSHCELASMSILGDPKMFNYTIDVFKNRCSDYKHSTQ